MVALVLIPTRLRWIPCLLPLLLFFIAPAPSLVVADEPAIVVLPGSFQLVGREASQRVLVQRREDGRFAGQATDATLTSSDPKVVVIEDGVARPVADGKAKIVARQGNQTAVAEVTVVGQKKPFRWSFRNHVESVLTKVGCNAGSCHGALAGKGGFRLTLRGYDVEKDFHTLTRESRGRRIIPGDPGRSLMLTKPTGAVPHGGGLRMDVGSLEYRVLSEWIAAGTPRPRADDARIERLEIFPSDVTLRSGQEQQLVVLAHFDDGHSEDVTRWAKYDSTNLSVAKVDDAGGVQVQGHGEGAITAYYLSRVVIATITSPMEANVPPEVFAKSPRRNFIDELVLAKLQILNIPPSPPASDATFLRRAHLDTIGVLPTVEEARAFLADTSPEKRDKLIEALLAREEFVDYWTYKWSDLLLVNGGKLKPAAMWGYYNWIRDNVASNTPWDEFVRKLVTAKGSTLEQGATNFFVLHQDPLVMAETTTQAFLGLSIGCAKCHNHPLEKWTNTQYYAMANLFARVRAKDGPGDGNRIIFDASEGDVVQPRTGTAQPPQPLDGVALALDSTADRRAHMARWLTSPKNPYFTRSIVNRVWANFMGVGIVENVDDLRRTNPPSNDPLLQALADDLGRALRFLRACQAGLLRDPDGRAPVLRMFCLPQGRDPTRRCLSGDDPWPARS